jgi:hypothetical protein
MAAPQQLIDALNNLQTDADAVTAAQAAATSANAALAAAQTAATNAQHTLTAAQATEAADLTAYVALLNTTYGPPPPPAGS